MHDCSNDDAAHSAACAGHPLIAQKGQIEEEESCEEVHEDLDALAGPSFAEMNQTMHV